MYIYSNYDHYKTNISIENISEKYINVHSNILFFWSYLLFCPFHFVYWMRSKYNSVIFLVGAHEPTNHSTSPRHRSTSHHNTTSHHNSHNRSASPSTTNHTQQKVVWGIIFSNYFYFGGVPYISDILPPRSICST